MIVRFLHAARRLLLGQTVTSPVDRGPAGPCLLNGDRAIEWSWAVAHLPDRPCRVLDVGCVHSALSAIAARMGHSVTAVDLNDIEYEIPGVAFRKGDINELPFGAEHFDVIVNCSTVEHVGLAGRYGSKPGEDGDLQAMSKLRSLMAPRAVMLLTIPVGLDATVSPHHRIYGELRLPRLLRGFNAAAEEFWHKPDGRRWTCCDRSTALATAGSECYYALGLFVLTADAGDSPGAECGA